MIIFIILGVALGLLLLWAGFNWLFGSNNDQVVMSFVLFVGVISIAVAALVSGVLYALIWATKFVIGLF